jgi:hypothetical protein
MAYGKDIEQQIDATMLKGRNHIQAYVRGFALHREHGIWHLQGQHNRAPWRKKKPKATSTAARL